MNRAAATGATAPCLYFPTKPKQPDYERCVEVSLLAAYQELYVNLQGREWDSKLETGIQYCYHRLTKPPVVQRIGFNAPWITQEAGDKIATTVFAIESGRRLARDLGGADPERMVALSFIS